MIRIVLPWPDKALNPNGRKHYMALSRAKKAYRDTCYLMARIAIGATRPTLQFSETGRIPVTITFYPPDARHRDDDNMIASFKSGRDGIADALAVNDRLFLSTYKFPGDKAMTGVVVFEAMTKDIKTMGDSCD